MPPAEFEPAIAARDRQQTLALDRSATRNGTYICTLWTIRGSNLGGGEIFRNPPDRVSFLVVKRPERGVNHPPHLVLR